MYSKSDIVIINFPFSDLLQAKKRPVLVLAEKGEDIICCAITSNPTSEGVLLTEFQQGNLPLPSKVKFWQIHTILKAVVDRKIARLGRKNYQDVLGNLSRLLLE